MTEIPVEAVDREEAPSLFCPGCEEEIVEADLGIIREGPFVIAFHDSCGTILGLGVA